MCQVFSCEFCEISKNTFSYRTPLVAASGNIDFQRSSIDFDFKGQLIGGKMEIRLEKLRVAKVKNLDGFGGWG